MQKKVLFVATVDSHIRFFHLPYLKYFKEQGYEVHVATNGDEEFPYCDVKHQVPMVKSPFDKVNIQGYKCLKKLIQQEHYQIIHCNMPMAAVLTRLAAKKSRKQGTKVIYTAHGFHFYKGSPLKNWILYYPIEKWCARYTDCLITINQEDYDLAQRRFKAKEIAWVKGMGVDLEKYKVPDLEERQRLRKSFQYADDDFILMYVAEISNRKNQIMLIEVIDELKEIIPQIKLILVGTDSLGGMCQSLVQEKDLTRQIQFLGERQDIDKLLAMPDIYISTSKQEGLPINILEAMASGKTVCATPIRGHVDLIRDGVNGYLFKDINRAEIIALIQKIYVNPNKYILDRTMIRKSIAVYEKSQVLESMKGIYRI